MKLIKFKENYRAFKAGDVVEAPDNVAHTHVEEVGRAEYTTAEPKKEVKRGRPKKENKVEKHKIEDKSAE